ncbi:hypothetical protein BDW72DRAFT_209266 [Aspergillus terricola var. indicus]
MPSSSSFVVHSARFHAILGESPTLELLFENEAYPFAHEAGVFVPECNKLFKTSNRIKDPASSGGQRVQITKVHFGNGTSTSSGSGTGVTCEELTVPIPMANGGVNYKDGTLFCAQGSMDAPSGLYYMSSKPPYTTAVLKADFHGRPFNSVNDVVVHTDGSIWDTGSIRAMADGFGRPNGICFSPDEQVVYVTDTDWIHGDGGTDDTRVSSIYAFDLITCHNQPFLANRRLFAFADSGIPDGIKCDLNGNVYSSCGDGVNICSPGGELLGRILVDGGVANFCFGREGEMFLLSEYRLWRVQLTGSARGALLGI